MALKLKTIDLNSPDGSYVDSKYDITIIIDENDELSIIDNTKDDWKEYVDCSTTVVRHYLINKNNNYGE